ncbi:MAG: hypothetical protein IID45_11570 [Planctomycetes bacterium]|nr:hypothetical protein [Planctomycetota bacterium]
MNASSFRIQLLVLSALAAVAIGLFLAPETVTVPIRTSVRDAVLPGHRAVEWGVDNVQTAALRFRNSGADPVEIDSPITLIENERLLSRRLRLENARLRQQLKQRQRIGVSPYRTGEKVPLLLDDLVSATVFGKETALLWKSGVLIDQGRNAGLREADIVLRDNGPIVDRGADAQLATGFPVFAGRCVFGRVSHVGRWTSTIQPVTDRKFRGHAQLVRKTGKGYVFGGEGVLEGDGDSQCRLTLIAAEEPVAVGDGVYTASRKTAFPFPMYYGKVTRAELPPGASHWQITVAPAIGDIQPQTVQILRKRINPERLRESGSESQP